MAFFLWITVFNLFAVAVFWSFMADVYDNVEARRYYGLHRRGGTLGAIAGPMLTRVLVERIGIAQPDAGMAGFLLLRASAARLRRHAGGARPRASSPTASATGGTGAGGLRLVAREPLLRWMAVLTVFRGQRGHAVKNNEMAAIVRQFYPGSGGAPPGRYYAEHRPGGERLTCSRYRLLW